MVDKAVVEEIVMEILRKQNVGSQVVETEGVVLKKLEYKPTPKKPMGETENHISETMDESMFELIADTMSAFRGQ